MKISGIYKITSPNERIYIGQSWDIKDRFRRYLSSSSSQLFLMNSFEKYGKNNHRFEILKIVNPYISQKLMDFIEIFYIAFYKKLGYNLMNIREGGSRGKLSENTKMKISIANKGKPGPNKDKKFTDSHKRKISEAKKGIKMSKEAIDKRIKTIKLRSRTEKEIEQFNNAKLLSIKAIKKPVNQYKDGILIKSFDSITSAAIELNLAKNSIVNNLNGRSYSAGGFQWEYKNK